MRTQPTKEERCSSDSSGQKQDPIERRRLQNRLSQRNHRRKIRDRIAKLQERVIASELRAAASLHGWDHPNSIAGSPAMDRIPSVFDPNGTSTASMVDASSGFASAYMSQSRFLCSSCNAALAPLPLYSTQTTIASPLYDITEIDASNTAPSGLRNHSYFPRSGSGGLDMLQGMSSAYSSTEANAPPLCEPWNGQTQYSGSSLYCITTGKMDPALDRPGADRLAAEAALPQIMQNLSTGPTRPKAIIVLSSSAQHASIPTSLPASQSPPTASSTIELSGSSSPVELHESLCQCQSQGSMIGSPGMMAAGEWVNAGTSTSVCPLHSMPADESMQLMMM
ncbi:transcription factor xanC [Aspergillus homomorphus CBS 101889]|uniref:BZIP domain-containing protein n=1 Tax=Aspergillus homomorphus (strain CBS 101889) TaxID=1450537 RepID=A0A395I999_ASPHC|nr:hypothetical protein BO97DRAFT_420194 [Aspergillus homomorphus CBS 101889]RAL16802.1 hypothetical protein BO97DRAFT_420194 [Aspergillus homomorphus CBS 101889]